VFSVGQEEVPQAPAARLFLELLHHRWHHVGIVLAHDLFRVDPLVGIDVLVHELVESFLELLGPRAVFEIHSAS